MAKMFDKLLLFIFSVIAGVISVYVLLIGLHTFSQGVLDQWIINIYQDSVYYYSFIISGIVLFLLSIRFFYVSIRRNNRKSHTIDQRTDYGDIRISIDTIENLTLKAASLLRGIKDLKARVKVSNAGLEITVRSLVDGETPIPALTEEMQRSVKDHVESITGIPVATVSVFIANIQQSANTFKSKSRVE